MTRVDRRHKRVARIERSEIRVKLRRSGAVVIFSRAGHFSSPSRSRIDARALIDRILALRVATMRICATPVRGHSDFERHVNNVHFNPVKHGLLARVRDERIPRFTADIPSWTVAARLGRRFRPGSSELW